MATRGNNLTVASMPTPFVPPNFESVDGRDLSACEVILIKASAAVGKSTLARAISATQGIPILDLAHTPVATGSLIGILNDYQGAISPVSEFHAGAAPILVDALDEGRLRSGDNGYLSFIESSAQLILQDRRHRKPKLMLLGREEAIAYAEMYLVDAGVEVTILNVGYFDESGAKELVHAYATASAKQDSQYTIHKKPADDLVETYFRKIADALSIPHDQLWDNPSGKSFAGYAPVLAAIGALLPEVENFAEAQNKLEDVRLNSAWSVIENVLDSIINREQGKVSTQLSNAGVIDPQGLLYSPQEQAALLLQHVQGLALTGTSKIRLNASDTVKYSDQVKRFLPEHPFVKDGRFSNEVIASYVVARAIDAGWKIQDHNILRQLARQPFLWRSLRGTLAGDAILEGEYLGYVLTSFWNDPLTKDERVEITDKEDDADAFVTIDVLEDSLTFKATTPVYFFGQIRNVTVNTDEPFTMVGIGEGSSQAFSFSGNNNVTGSMVDLRATEIHLRNGRTWLDADIVPAAGQLSLIIADGVEYGWSAQLSNVYPFSIFPSTINADEVENRDRLAGLLSDLAARSPVGTSLMLHADYSVPENDYLRTIFSEYGHDFKTLMTTLVGEGWANSAPMQVKGPPKVRVRFKASFGQLRDAALKPAQDGELNTLIALLRQRIV
ncbi:hypothetical protein [Sphingomonas taxi]|uniref:hypothetical protein n=1 Tax=Sphingomonas taxi TaxID=1549858 RepID=UPI0012E07AAE|nr:hypothetical protein [Sphingomonas taxi]